MAAISLNQMSIHTYRIENESPFLEPRGATILMPAVSKDFSVSEQDGKMEIRAVVHSATPEVSHLFYLRPTGVSLQGNEGDYIGTFSLYNGYFVGHLFKGQSSILSSPNRKRVIYKYPIIDGDESKIVLPEGAQKICTFVKKGTPYVYAIVNSNSSS